MSPVHKSGSVRLTKLSLLAAVMCVFATIACGGKSKSGPPTSASANAPASVAGTPATSRATPGTGASPAPAVAKATPTETPDDSPMARLVVPKININAKFVTLGIVASTNTMDSPKNKDDVAYYDFTPRPGYGGNTVLSGHVDWFTGQTGVFWDLKKLEKGDELDIVLEDGKKYRYKITETQLYNSDDAPIDQILGDTPVESVTMITCEGSFNPSSAEYNKRRVVRAERITL
jgi:sortase A